MLLLLLACQPPDDASGSLSRGTPSGPEASPAAPSPLAAPPASAPASPARLGAAPPSVPGAGGLVLNEVMTRNDSTWMTSDGRFPDWIELYNGSSDPIDLSRVSLITDAGPWTGATGTLAPGGWAVIDTLPGLDGDGDHLDLLLDGAVVDSVATGALVADTEWGRFPDGGAWALTTRSTPGWTNGSGPGTSTDPSEDFYQDDEIEDVWITLPQSSWDILAASPYTEVPGTLAWRNVYYPEISVRRKGVYGSLRSLDQKVGLKIDMNEYVDARLRGIETFSFNNMVQDPSYIHEALAYEVFRAVGVPAPRTGYLRMYLNGEYIGLYVNVESVDDTFLARWFSDNTGNLYEGSYGVDFYDGYEFYFECDECTDPNDRSDITAVSQILDQTPNARTYAALRDVVDMDEFLTYMAVEALLWHWDGYTTSNNYRVYHDPTTGKFSIIPWGTDQTWVDEWYGPFDAYGRIFQWCMADLDCTSDYLDKMDYVADTMDTLDIGGEATSLLAMLQDDIETDPRAEFSIGTHNSYVRATYATIGSTAQRIRDAAADKRTELGL